MGFHEMLRIWEMEEIEYWINTGKDWVESI
jgi:hypothetical protein